MDRRKTPSPQRFWPQPTRCTPRNSSGSSTPPGRPGCGCRPSRRWRTMGAGRRPARSARAAGARRRGTALEAAVAAVVDDLADAEIAVDQDVPTESAAFESRTVAVLNRGVPGFAVDSDGTLHTSLMRSCTGWPSGTWIDPPRRTAPDGSNFQLQHWTHTFDYAVVSGDGDWREAGIPARSAEFSRPLLGGRQNTSGRTAGCPRGARCWRSSPRARCTRCAEGGGQPDGLRQQPDHPPVGRRRGSPGRNIRYHNRCHRPFGAASGIGRGSRRPARTATRAASSDGLTLHGYEIATVLTRLNMPQVLDADHAVLAPDAEAAQPLYARYWLHNRGPAPLGGLPAVAHLHPHHSRLSRIRQCSCGLPQPATAATRCCTAGCGCCARTAGRPNPPSCRSSCHRASTWRQTCR